ncbi:MAG TPA: hypothetical protein VMY99_00535 [Nevskiaceae bacterium]|nr:hypothetical protein [Nevskiaceae bacterium]
MLDQLHSPNFTSLSGHEAFHPDQLHLDTQQQELLTNAVSGRNAGFKHEINSLEAVGQQYPIAQTTETVGGVRSELTDILGAKLEAHLATPAGQTDAEIAHLRQLVRDPQSMTVVGKTALAQALGVQASGLRGRLTAKSTRDRRLHAAAQTRLAELTAGEPADIAEQAKWDADSIAHPALRQPTESRGPDKPESATEMLATLEAHQAKQAQRQQRFIQAWEAAQPVALRSVLKALARQELTADELVDHLQHQAARGDNEARRALGSRLSNGLGWLRNAAVKTFAQASLVGNVYGPVEKSLVQAYEQAASSLASVLHNRPTHVDVAGPVEQSVAVKQAELAEAGIDSSHTQYWHFTPNTRKIAQNPARALKPGAADDVQNTTGAHSRGVHFIKPGDWHDLKGTETGQMYMDYAHVRQTQTGERIRGGLGSAVVFPLGILAKATPLRNERKIIAGDDGQHRAADATFRRADNSANYQYSLRDAFVVPFYDSNQVPYEAIVIDSEAHPPKFKPVAEPVREIFRQANYPDWWIAERIIDIPDDIFVQGAQAVAVYAQAEIAERLERMGPAQAVVPLESKQGQWETLDTHGQTRSGYHSKPDIETLITAAA